MILNAEIEVGITPDSSFSFSQILILILILIWFDAAEREFSNAYARPLKTAWLTLKGPYAGREV